MSVCEAVAKITARRWTPFVCGVAIVSRLVNMCIMVYLINRPDLFSAEFTGFLQSVDWGDFDLLGYMGTGGANLIIIFFSVVFVAASLAECGRALYRTLKRR